VLYKGNSTCSTETTRTLTTEVTTSGRTVTVATTAEETTTTGPTATVESTTAETTTTTYIKVVTCWIYQLVTEHLFDCAEFPNMFVEHGHARLGNAEMCRVMAQLLLVLRSLLHQNGQISQWWFGFHTHTLALRKVLQLLNHLPTRRQQRRCQPMSSCFIEKKICLDSD